MVLLLMGLGDNAFKLRLEKVPEVGDIITVTEKNLVREPGVYWRVGKYERVWVKSVTELPGGGFQCDIDRLQGN